MSGIFDWWDRLGLQWKLQILIQGFLLVILLSFQHWLSNLFEHELLNAAKERASAITDGTINGLNTLMVTKAGGNEVISDPVSRALFIKKMGLSEKIKELRVVRSKAVVSEFGDGLPQERPVDDLDRAVLADGKPQMIVSDNGSETSLRTVLPFIAKKDLRGTNCLKCHGVDEGAVLGVLSLTLDIKDDLASIKNINAKLWLGQGLLQIILLFAVRFIAHSITGPISQAVKIAQTVAAGDLTCRINVTSKGQTGQLVKALKSMIENLAKIVYEVRSSSNSIATASAQIATDNIDLSARTEAQAAAVEQIASTMEELISTVKQNSDNAHQARELAVSASDVAIKGSAAVSQVVDTMESINDSSKKIVDIIGVIDGIAFQTNILALNAAVEAARAGEQGRGFAVVAAEVRNLAQRSAAAAKEIKMLINNSVERVSIGAKLVDQAGATMNEVVTSVKRVTDIIGEISRAGKEQTSGIEQINEAMIQLDAATQQNAALVEQATAAAHFMHDQTNGLAQMVNVFILDKRIAPRTKLCVPAQLLRPGLPPVNANTVDVSTTGICVVAPLTLEVGKEFELSFRVPLNGGIDSDVRVVAQSVCCIKSERNGYMVGMRFINNGISKIDHLYKFIEEAEA